MKKILSLMIVGAVLVPSLTFAAESGHSAARKQYMNSRQRMIMQMQRLERGGSVDSQEEVVEEVKERRVLPRFRRRAHRATTSDSSKQVPVMNKKEEVSEKVEPRRSRSRSMTHMKKNISRKSYIRPQIRSLSFGSLY